VLVREQRLRRTVQQCEAVALNLGDRKELGVLVQEQVVVQFGEVVV
jgi:formylmethanofuran dehydrogenase subunit D